MRARCSRGSEMNQAQTDSRLCSCPPKVALGVHVVNLGEVYYNLLRVEGIGDARRAWTLTTRFARIERTSSAALSLR